MGSLVGRINCWALGPLDPRMAIWTVRPPP
ncbi:hypothetical protein COLO4_24252 [Corchorus olitorius]|uniref:Uncharacterized protein n=1 Tax=Corchorus olitorius TaxID=93759 RepID=A0A1R3IBY2_9ROSI|nr:hypothetical protein COLO4_24252 [Corchorus olitorius]